MKWMVIILGFLAIIGFSYYYEYPFIYHEKATQLLRDQTNFLIWLSLSAAYLYIGLGSIGNIRYIYYSVAEFWLFLTIAYLFNYLFDYYIAMLPVVISIILTTICSLLLYYIYWKK